MDLKDALRDAQYQRDIAMMERDTLVADLDKKMAVLDTEIEGLRLAIGRHNGEMTEATPQPNWLELPRTRAVTETMNLTGRPLAPSEISRLLKEKGRQETSEDISQTLQYLKNKPKPAVKNLGRRQWVLIDPDDPEGDQGREVMRIAQPAGSSR